MRRCFWFCKRKKNATIVFGEDKAPANNAAGLLVRSIWPEHRTSQAGHDSLSGGLIAVDSPGEG